MCIAAAAVLYGTGHPVLLSLAIVNAIVEFASWRHMCYFAKMLAHNRLFVEKLDSGELGTTDVQSEEAHQYWQHQRRSVTMDDANARDIEDVPDWITIVNMVAFVIGIALLVFGAIIRLRQ